MSQVLLDGFQATLPDTRAYEGCVSVEVFIDVDVPDTLLLIEEWESRSHYEQYMAWRIETGTIALLESILESPLEVRFLDPRPV